MIIWTPTVLSILYACVLYFCICMIIWTSAVLSILYVCVLYFCICTCSAQLGMFHMERRSRNTLIIIFYYKIQIDILTRSIANIPRKVCKHADMPTSEHGQKVITNCQSGSPVVMISSKMTSRKHVEIFPMECRRSLLGRVNSVGVEAILVMTSVPPPWPSG